MLAEMGVRVWQPSDAVQTPSSVRAELALADKNQIPVLGQSQDERASSIAVPVRREPPLRLPVLSSPPAPAGSVPLRYVIGNLPTDSAAVPFDFVLFGEPCTGDAEKLLTSMALVLGAKNFVAQMVPAQNESESLLDQLKKLPAKVLVALGPHAAKALLGEASQAMPFGKLRGAVHAASGLVGKVIVTYHPLQLLRQPLAKAQAWTDLKLAMKEAA